MYKNSKVKFNKKGLLALEALVSIILSIMALFLVLQIFVGILSMPSNQKTAQGNIESIKQFIDFSTSNEYSNLAQCYTMLKLKNLENFQYLDDDENKNYYYIIGNEGITFKNYINYQKDIDKIKSKTFKILKYQETFENSLKIYVDETSSGSNINIYGLFGFDSKINLGSEIRYILLIPDFGFDVFENEIIKTDILQNENRYRVKLIKNDWSIEDVGGQYLILIPEKKIMFVTDEEIGEVIVRNDLCSVKYLKKELESEFYKKNPEKINYLNNKITFFFKYENGVESEVKFIWENGPKCQPNSCENYFNDEKYKISFGDFRNEVRNFYQNDKDKFSNGIRDFRIEKLNNYNEQGEVYFKDVFQLHKEDFSKWNRDEMISKNVFDISNGIWDSITSFSINKEINGCNRGVCNYIRYTNGVIYFFVNNLNGNQYYTFNSYFFNKVIDSNGNFNIYFNGESIDFESIPADRFGISITEEDKNFYFLKNLNIEGKKYDVIISGTQFREIPEVNEI